MAMRRRKGCWRMSANSIVQRAPINRWLHKQGVPDMRTSWMDGPAVRAKSPGLTGTAVCRAARAVGWHPWLAWQPSVSPGGPISFSC